MGQWVLIGHATDATFIQFGYCVPLLIGWLDLFKVVQQTGISASLYFCMKTNSGSKIFFLKRKEKKNLWLHSIVETGSLSPPTRSLRSDGYNRMWTTKRFSCTLGTTNNPFQGLSNRVATAHPVVSVRVVVNS